jgi:serine/threonine-protein kinase
VAIKILLPTEDLDVVARFVNEARAATSIGNPHIVDTIDFGQLPDESTYFAMEYLEGQTLAAIIKETGYLPVHRALHVAKQIAEGMSAAHAADIVHRDLKPENVFITQRGKATDFVKLLDFGIAKVATAQNRITRAGTIFGTPHYMSPEQAAGTEVDHRSDVYSLGVMLYEMVSGRTPFEAENTMGLLTQHMYTLPKPLTDRTDLPQSVPVQLDAIVLKCLAKRPEDRYGSMREVIEDLERLEQGKNPAAFADLLGRRDQELAAVRAAARAASRGSLSRIWLVGGIALALGVGAAVITRQVRQRPLPTAIDSSGEAIPSSSATPEDGVSLVFSPIDAEVFRGNTSLGGMPVTIHVEPGHPVRVVIKRDGFYPEPVVIDGSKHVVVVRLQKIPGATPAVPVPDDSPLERFAEEHELDMSTMLLSRSDAGPAPTRRDAGAHRVRAAEDAGASNATTRAAAPPALRPANSESVGSPSSPSGAGEPPEPPLEDPPTTPSE